MKISLKIIGAFFGAIAIVFILELVGLGFSKFFEPKRENIRREIFEETKSYVHGKTQDLSKYYNEWRKAETKDKEAIESLVRMQFAEFDSENIRETKLKNFLTQIRGY